MKLILAPIILLAGCASTTPFNSVEVLAQTSYITRTAPDVLKQLPPLPPRIANPRTATNNQVATFISNSEEYIANLEAQIRVLVRLYETPVPSNSVVPPIAAPAPAVPIRARVPS